MLMKLSFVLVLLMSVFSGFSQYIYGPEQSVTSNFHDITDFSVIEFDNDADQDLIKPVQDKNRIRKCVYLSRPGQEVKS